MLSPFLISTFYFNFNFYFLSQFLLVPNFMLSFSFLFDYNTLNLGTMKETTYLFARMKATTYLKT